MRLNDNPSGGSDAVSCVFGLGESRSDCDDAVAVVEGARANLKHENGVQPSNDGLTADLTTYRRVHLLRRVCDGNDRTERHVCAASDGCATR